MTAKLDRKKKYAKIYGKSKARFYQDGNYFDAQGRLISPAAAAKTHGVTRAEARELEIEDNRLDEDIDGDDGEEGSGEGEGDDNSGAEATGGSETEGSGDGEGTEGTDGTDGQPNPLPDPKNPPDEDWTKRYEELKGEHHKTLSDMCAAAYEDMKAQGQDVSNIPTAPFSGQGSSDLNARWLATYVVLEEEGGEEGEAE